MRNNGDNKMNRLAVIIINYKTPTLVQDCIQSLSGQIQVGLDQVVVVDNNSADGSVEQLEKFIAEKQLSGWVKLIASSVNGGFAAGNNIGIRAIEAQYYMLLNSDTIVRSGAIDNLLSVASKQNDVGIVSPRLEWPDGTPQGSCFRQRTPRCEFFAAAGTGILEKLFRYNPRTFPPSQEVLEPDWVSFACVLINGKTLKKIGLLDERYFMYFDDVDFCRRTLKAGYRILYWPTSRVVHLRGGSGPVKKSIVQRKRPPAYLYASRAYYYTKFFGRAGLVVANLLWLAGRMVSLLRELFGSKHPHICKRQWLDIWMT